MLANAEQFSSRGGSRMGFVAAPATCAECHIVEILNIQCRTCRIHFCDVCAKELGSRCPVCKGRLQPRGFELL